MNDKKVLNYLKVNCLGRSNIRKSRTIENALHMSGNELRRHIARLRKEQEPIASSNDGYFYADNPGEVYDTIRQLERMKRGLESSIDGLVGSLRNHSFGGDAP